MKYNTEDAFDKILRGALFDVQTEEMAGLPPEEILQHSINHKKMRQITSKAYRNQRIICGVRCLGGIAAVLLLCLSLFLFLPKAKKNVVASL